MALCPFAVRRLLPENATQTPIDPDQVIFHTAVDAPGDTTLYGFFAGSTTLESHFFVKNDGTIEQYMDTRVRADANSYANSRAVSIETEDDGRPDIIPWTPQQVAALVRLTDWICATHPKVARRRCPAWDQPGIGYHSMWGAPSKWTPSAGKTCPGAARIPQVPGIIAAVSGGTPINPEVDDMYDYAARNEVIGRLDTLLSAMSQVHPAVAQIHLNVLALANRPVVTSDVEAIAALIPDAIAKAVADALVKRLEA